jgi:hypothetical protein
MKGAAGDMFRAVAESVAAFNAKQDRTRPIPENVKTCEKMKRLFEVSYASQPEIFKLLAEI